jgi:transcriptional regulator with XRE-family HTH domain
MMLKRGVSQSELARRMWGVTTDKRGFDVAKNRDRISLWLKGARKPDARNLGKLAEHLQCSVDELVPVRGRRSQSSLFTSAFGGREKAFAETPAIDLAPVYEIVLNQKTNLFRLKLVTDISENALHEIQRALAKDKLQRRNPADDPGTETDHGGRRTSPVSD